MTEKFILHTYYSDGSDAGGTMLPRTLTSDEMSLIKEVLEICQPTTKEYKFVKIDADHD